MRVAMVGGDMAMSLVHGPVVDQTVDIAVLGLILRSGRLMHVAPDVVEA